MNRLVRRFLLTILAIAGTLAVGTAGFTVIDHYPPFDAFYMTLTTMTTVGYGEIHPLSHAGRVFNSFLIMFGVTTILIAIGAMTQTIIELELGDRLHQRRNKRMIDKLKNHFIICGLRTRGARRGGTNCCTPECPSWWWTRTRSAPSAPCSEGMLAVAADATRDETLRQVGIEHARGLVAALATDADNLFVLLSAKGLNPGSVRGRARGRGRRRGENAAGRRQLGVRALRAHRASPGAGAAAAPRGAVPGFHHPGYRTGHQRSNRSPWPPTAKWSPRPSATCNSAATWA